MTKIIPQEVKNLYLGLGLKTNLYINSRWRLCPFEKLEKYLPDSGLILDIGCGYGLLSNFLVLKSNKRQVIGIDNFLERLKIAKLSSQRNSKIKYIQADIRDFDLPKCQGVVMSDFLHHLPISVSQDLLKKIFNSLNPGGRLIIEEVDNRPFWKYLSNILIDNLLYFGQKINFKSADYWQESLKKIGFQVEIIPAHHGLPLADVILVCKK